jgi:hypothetical protein
MRNAVMGAAFLTFMSAAGAWAQTGMTYRFQEDTLVGRVWVSGEHARREIETGEGGTAAGRVEIWRNGGKEIFVLDPKSRTYFEEHAFRARQGLNRVSVEPLTVRVPFRVERIDDVRVDLRTLPRTEMISGYSCRRTVLTFSYTLTVHLADANVSMPGRVEGSQDVCLMDVPNTTRLPFGHRIEFTSGHPDVDAAVAARLAGLTGMPVARLLKVTRRIETGDPVSAVSVLLVSEVEEATIPADRFDVPGDYRFREPEIGPHVRTHP